MNLSNHILLYHIWTFVGSDAKGICKTIDNNARKYADRYFTNG